ncbi:MAG: hypothetical protein KME27_04755 [Lyngbya sp. HA4199-MV5]|jgi:hypothetical protein|nr:hypothetical protein [Lyngbya sp. HA4199-MV5]
MVLSQKMMSKGKWLIAAIVMSVSMLSAHQVQAGTAAYFAKCSFLDRGNNNGGSVSRMPCYAVEGVTASTSFFHIVWRDGVKTRLNARAGDLLREIATGRTYERAANYTFVANSDGDVITLDDVKSTNSRYNADDPTVIKLLK